MEIRSGWLERSLDRAQTNVEQRPERLKPEKYRTKRASAGAAKKKRQTAG
jgi:hypothetical protein